MTSDTPGPETDQPIINIVGEKVALGPIHRGVLPLYLRWFNDPEYARTTGGMGSGLRPMTREVLEGAFDHAARATDEAHFVIYERATLRPIGGTDLTEITGRTATFAIGIGEKECWGKGYGTETTRLMLDSGFKTLGLHNIMLTVQGHNARGIRAYLRAGFRIIGHRHEVVYRDGHLHDLIYMECLASEYPSAGPRVTGLDHVQVAAPANCEVEARAFYGDALGLAEIPKPANLRARGGVWFRCGAQELHVGVQGDFRPATKAHPALAVYDLAGLRRRLAERNVPIVEDEPLDGAERFYVADPFGNRIELLERVPG
jgi:RimJ/RimL family protein N-acetyltransferase/catechol 2,3-dioxygenase-like lactoylglutathione lyase family enzyme